MMILIKTRKKIYKIQTKTFFIYSNKNFNFFIPWFLEVGIKFMPVAGAQGAINVTEHICQSGTSNQLNVEKDWGESLFTSKTSKGIDFAKLKF